MSITPVFLVSQPRSGSTFVQRVIAAHPQVATTAEPWILLPLLSPLQRPMTMEDGWQSVVSNAVGDFLEELPEGEEEYLREVRGMTLRLYERAAGGNRATGTTHFLDKTPPYHLVIDQMLRAFPEEPFVFLWRNPLSVLASCVETFQKGRWHMSQMRLFLFEGLVQYVDAYAAHRDRVLGVRYEDLVVDEEPWHALMAFLGLDFREAQLESFSGVALAGRMKDVPGAQRYRQRSSEPVDKWRATICNPLRVEWARRYLHWIGRERLEVMGYDLDLLLHDLAATPTSSKKLAEDVFELGHTGARELGRAIIPGNRLRSSLVTLARTPGR